MKKVFTAVFLVLTSLQAYADIFSPFRNPDGSTKWQWVANFSGSVLFLCLLILTLFLLLANHRAKRANRELTEIKANLEDRVIRRTASLIETTEILKSREQYITNIVESMPLMLIGLNQHMDIIQWNHVAETATGRARATVLGKNLWEVYPTITLTPEQVSQVLQSQQTMTIKHGQRDQYYFDITLYALTDKGETGVIILVDDITKQMKAENKVSERDKMSAMGELSSAMAYDMNIPLESILTNLQEAANSLAGEGLSQGKDELLDLLAKTKLSGHQARAIIQNLLDLAASHYDQKKETDIPSIMDQSIALAENLFNNSIGLRFNDITLIRNYHNDLPKLLCFDLELQQVFVRLLRNAFYSLNRESQVNPKIQIEVSNFYDSLWIKVHHNGRVLSDEEQEDIFQPFFSISSRPPACKVEHRLSYSYFIITDHHDGQIAVTSNEQFGTCFNIQLPLA